MRLEIGNFRVQEVAFGNNTRFSEGVLYVDKNRVRELVPQDDRFLDMEVHLVKPGDSAGIVNLVGVRQLIAALGCDNLSVECHCQ